MIVTTSRRHDVTVSIIFLDKKVVCYLILQIRVKNLIQYYFYNFNIYLCDILYIFFSKPHHFPFHLFGSNHKVCMIFKIILYFNYITSLETFTTSWEELLQYNLTAIITSYYIIFNFGLNPLILGYSPSKWLWTIQRILVELLITWIKFSRTPEIYQMTFRFFTKCCTQGYSIMLVRKINTTSEN